jgi:hypothetical protein
MARQIALVALLVIGTLVPAHAEQKSDCTGHRNQ